MARNGPACGVTGMSVANPERPHWHFSDLPFLAANVRYEGVKRKWLGDHEPTRMTHNRPMGRHP